MGGRFDSDVLTPDPGRRRPMLELLDYLRANGFNS